MGSIAMAISFLTDTTHVPRVQKYQRSRPDWRAMPEDTRPPLVGAQRGEQATEVVADDVSRRCELRSDQRL